MVTTRNGMHGLIILTITDRRGNVVLHETVKPDSVDEIVSKVLPTIK